MTDSRNSADICRERGWVVGTRLFGDEGYGPIVIQITGIGERSILAKAISFNGVKPKYDSEFTWSLIFRDWKIVDD